MVTQLIATNRKGFSLDLDNDKQLEVAAELAFGKIDFDPCDPLGDTDRYSPFRTGETADYHGCLTADKDSLVGYAQFFRELHELTKASDKEILFFVHGYRHPVSRLKRTIRRLQKAYVDEPGGNISHIVMMSWPSTEDTGEYDEDRDRAIATGEGAFLKFLIQWRKFLCEAFPEGEGEKFAKKFNLVAASMGNRLLQHTGNLVDTDGFKIVNELILTGADVGYKQFYKDMGLSKLAQLACRVHVYFNNADAILLLSTLVENELEDRLGRIGAPLDTHFDPLVHHVDVTLPVVFAFGNPDVILDPKDELDFPVLHTYFVKSQRIVKDAREILAHVKDIPGRIGTPHRQAMLL